MPPPIFRFAPSPNGHLHLGHAYSALLNFDLARRRGGRLLLRIEDIDATRCRPEFETAIYQDLGWLGIVWETPVRRQSEHFAFYREAIERLAGQGLIYPGFESRAEIARLVAQREAEAPWPRDPDGAPLYPGVAKSLSAEERKRLIEAGTPYALRLEWRRPVRVPKSRLTDRGEAGQRAWRSHGPAGSAGYVILARETPTSYHLSVVVDDALQGITEVVRGRTVLVDQRPSSAATAARSAATRLPASPAAARCRRPKTVKIDPGDRPA